jgi:predicted permease
VLSSVLPLGADTISIGFSVDGYVPQPDERPTVFVNFVSNGYLDSMGIRLVDGRAFTAHDRQDSEPVAIVNEAIARRYWPDGNTVGGSMRVGRDQCRVIGVTANSRHVSLKGPVEPLIYRPVAQRYVGWAYLQVRTEGDPGHAVAPVLRELEKLDPNLPASSVKTFEDHLGFVFLPARFLSALVGVFGLLALVIALVGVYGVVAYVVGQRTGEFGVRAALGASRSNLFLLVLRQGLGIALGGVLIGLGAAAGLTRLLTTLLHGVSPLDPIVFSAVGILLITAVVGASLAPAGRAARVSPSRALRYE